jgi:predicted regulator of Ras-like GTPase activity (Roadblock/LC7/MglB family)
MSAAWAGLLDGITRVRGVRGALLISADDGLVVAEASMGDVDGAATAALAGGLAARLGRLTGVIGCAEPRVVMLEAERGGLMAAPAGERLLLVAVTDAEANFGLLRLALRDAAERVA